MESTKIIQRLKERKKLTEKLEQIEELRKKLNAEILDIEIKIQEEACNNMVGEVTIDDEKYKISTKTEYYIQETKSNHDKKIELFHRLEMMGHGEEIQYFQTGFLHKTKFKKIMNSLPVETINQMVDDKLISTFRLPDITSRKVK